jgi:hypothetical protein
MAALFSTIISNITPLEESDSSNTLSQLCDRFSDSRQSVVDARTTTFKVFTPASTLAVANSYTHEEFSALITKDFVPIINQNITSAYQSHTISKFKNIYATVALNPQTDWETARSVLQSLYTTWCSGLQPAQ